MAVGYPLVVMLVEVIIFARMVVNNYLLLFFFSFYNNISLILGQKHNSQDTRTSSETKRNWHWKRLLREDLKNIQPGVTNHCCFVY